MGTVFVLLRTICQSVLSESLQFQAECVEKEEEEDNMKRKKDGLREWHLGLPSW